MAKRKSSAKPISLNIGAHKHLPAETAHQIKVVVGTGDRDIQFPTDLAGETLKRARGKAGKIPAQTADTRDSTDSGDGEGTIKLPRLPVRKSLLFGSGSRSLWDILRPSVPVVSNDADFRALVNGADAIQQAMLRRQFDGIMEQIFGDLEDTAAWAVNNMDPQLRTPFADHQRQVVALRKEVETALPKVVAELARRNPGAPPAAVMQHGVKMMAEQLGPIVSVLGIYSEAISQYRSGRFARKLKALNLYMESCYRLWINGDVEGLGTGAAPQIPMSSLTVGARLLSMIGGPGLGTIPAAKGPLGLSLLMYPLDMLDWVSLALTLNSHESGHQIFADIKAFEVEMQQVVQTAVREGAQKGTLTFVSPRSKIGSNSVATSDLVVKMITDCIGEIEADAAAVLVNGPAFLYGMLLSFPAMLIREGRVKDAKRLLRTGSVYMLAETETGDRELEFESHPPDYIRAYLVAAMIEEIGYKAEADLLRRLADQMVGNVIPESLTWEDASGRSRTVISIKTADIKSVAPVVAKALLRAKLTSLGGKCLSDLVLWQKKQQDKAVALKERLLAGQCDIPADKGSMYPSLVGSAAAMAYWEAIHSKEGTTVLPALDENVLKMLEALAIPGK